MTIELRVADYEPVLTVLSAAGDLARAVDAALCDDNIADTRAHAVLSAALREFKATVAAQADA